MTSLNWKVGFEIELLAPAGKSRLDLAKAIALDMDSEIHRFFHPQSEPSKVPGAPIFHNLTFGYEVRDKDQQVLAKCVDDLTLQGDLRRNAKPIEGWYRIVSDDERLLHLIARQTDAQSSLEDVLTPIGDLFGTIPEPGPGGMLRVNDEMGASIAIAVPLPGERERPCELITAPIDTAHQERLESLLSLARTLGFTAPKEGATHIHFDAMAMKSAHAMANLVNLLCAYGKVFKKLVGTNPNCSRLGMWPESLYGTVNRSGFRALSWPDVQKSLLALDLTKYCDFNLVNCLRGFQDKNTIEVRILPVFLEAEPIIQSAALFAAVLQSASNSDVIEPIAAQKFSVETVKDLLERLPLSPEQLEYWQRRSSSLIQKPIRGFR
ncbi:amidoligase family protein [Acaryochloris marina NIES-2412]|uniref:amidoligase family protein n=1 Tax=Acaryochloris marina TaxID=155978 RepID=UPI00405827F4